MYEKKKPIAYSFKINCKNKTPNKLFKIKNNRVVGLVFATKQNR